MSTSDELHHEIGPFRLFPARRLLLDGEQPVRLGGRALDLLLALVERPGQLIPKDELIRRVWPGTVVEDTSLRVHIAALRKVLGEALNGGRCIANVPGQGYAFVGPVRSLAAGAAGSAASPGGGMPALTPLPMRLPRLVGRRDAVRELSRLQPEHRFVTIVGEGGVGKTTLALAVAERGASRYADGVCFADLSVHGDAARVCATVGRALGASLPGGAAPLGLQRLIADRHLLLVLDNCEHLVDTVAALGSALLRHCPRLHILATSREPVCIEGERIHRLDALSVPPAGAALTAAAAMAYESVELLVERLEAAHGGFVLREEDAEAAAELCRRLDGVPLAIELAAARVGVFGLNGLLERLSDRLHLLSAGRRTVAPRHQTLRALYDWSHELLDAQGRQAFARLSVFAGAFSLDAALAVLGRMDAPGGALDVFLDLVSKSLVAADMSGRQRCYRLLESARLYAGETLCRGERRLARLAQARHLIETLAQANPAWTHATRQPWLSLHAPLLDDINQVLDWAASEEGDALLGGRLAFESFQLVQQLSLQDLHRPRLAKALARLGELAQPPAGLLAELRATLAIATGYSAAVASDGPAISASDGLAGADVAASADLLYGREISAFSQGEYRKALVIADELQTLCAGAGDEHGVVIAKRMKAFLWHYLGEHARARALAAEVLAVSAGALRLGGRRLDPVDRRLSMRIVLARIHWLEGDTDGAFRLIEESFDYARFDMHYARCHVLALAACPIALWSGLTARAAQYLAELRELAERHEITYWHEWVDALQCVLDGRASPRPGAGAKLRDLLATLSPSLVDAAVLARAESGEAGWCAAELLRAHGEQLLLSSPERAAEALAYFQRALRLARQQGAVRWEQRAALSLARLSARMARESA